MSSTLGVYSPKMKDANWLKLTWHQERSLLNIFSLWNIWYKSMVLSLIWLYILVCQINKKQMSQLVAHSGNICVWVVSCNECGGLTVLATLSQHKESHGPHGNLYEGEQEQCCSVPVGALYGGLRISQWHKLCWSEMCGVDSPLDKLAIGVRVGPSMATVVEKQQHTSTTTPLKRRTNALM